MVPKSLRTWFVVHFIADMVVGIPLLFAPGIFLAFFDWPIGETFSLRVVGAAFMGIGWESLLGRNGSVDQFRGMLRLKLIWSSSAIIGMSLGLVYGSAPAVAWLFIGIFAVFFGIWANYAFRLRQTV